MKSKARVVDSPVIVPEKGIGNAGTVFAVEILTELHNNPILFTFKLSGFEPLEAKDKNTLKGNGASLSLKFKSLVE